jgi:hypothetical protein
MADAKRGIRCHAPAAVEPLLFQADHYPAVGQGPSAGGSGP